MKLGRTFATVAALAVIPLVATANQQDQGATGDQDAPTRAQAGDKGKAAGPAQLMVQSEKPYGQHLVDSSGRTLYMFTPDRGQQDSTCYDACAEAWPPLLTDGDPRAAAPRVNEKQLGTIQRRDGSLQVTYGGLPLYYFVKDQRPGDIKGQDVHGFGGEWYLVSPAGDVIEATKQPRSQKQAP